MILIKNFIITENGSKLEINVETNETFNIDKILFWKMNDFKNSTLSIDLSNYLLKTSNVENLIIYAEELDLDKFEDLCFIEITSTYPDLDNCGNLLSPSIGITYDLSQYYGCLLSQILKIPLDCTTCNTTTINQTIITINMLIDTIKKSVEIGYYTEAVKLTNDLKLLCNTTACTNCKPVECLTCNNFTQL